MRLPGVDMQTFISEASDQGVHIGVDVSDRVEGKDNSLLLISFSDVQSDEDCDQLVKVFETKFGAAQDSGTAAPKLTKNYLRSLALPLPQIPLEKIVKYYQDLGEQNVSPDENIYALGSCTMKYNPYINEYAAGLAGFVHTHPQAPEADVQGCLEVIYETQEWFKEICGLPALTTQPVAGAQGELVGLKMFQAYHEDRGQGDRDVLLIPRSAHGTNPATASMAGFVSRNAQGENAGVVLIEADGNGCIDMDHLRALIEQYNTRICGVMVTNPNTSGIFEANFREMADLIHEVGGLVYMDGANMNAIAGWVDLGKLGVDAVHNNTHKTWSIPHGGGGPGDAFVAVSAPLADYLPGKQVVLDGDVYRTVRPKKSIGSFHRHFGNFAHKVRCFCYLRALGRDGIKKMSAMSVLSARYLFHHLRKVYPSLPAGADSAVRMHEFILTLKKEDFERIEQAGLKRAVAIPRLGKLFLDFGLHAPTVAFPEMYGLMVEPTECYSQAELDRFVSIVTTIHEILEEHPEVLKTVPHFTPWIWWMKFPLARI